ncbi:helix-turn-helix domain-containing protein [Kocuria turfanensis]|uniref:helix-turn-helix domain-containing protein n=1 Tax=Kocuria turfanensis TaxID=388357 RepID=UPI0007873538|nr:helix-turn-helix transcriptional regulator [Kocuria turfanensis]
MDKSISSQRHRQLARLLRELRIRTGMSQAEVAELIDEDQSFVSRYEGGLRRLDLVELEQVAFALGVPLRQIVELFEEIETP